jgi:RimJ/RimL family protein N-acetyltransferase
MVELSTERLRVFCLDLDAFRLYVHDHGRLQRQLGVAVTAEELDPAMREPFLPALGAAEADAGRALWYSNWQVVVPALGRVAGGVCFKGPPDARGEVEIGYGLDPDFRGHGYMTETVGAVISWAFAQDGVTAVLAETDLENGPSHAVLVRCGFRRDRETPTSWWWRRERM